MILDLKIATLDAFWTLLFTVQLFGLDADSTAFRLGKLAITCMQRLKRIKTSLIKRVF